MKALIIALLLFAIKCSAQSGEIGPLPIAPPIYDTIPCHLLYRTKAGQVGVVKGWQVKQSTKHVTYLLANRRRFPKGTEVWKLEQPIKQQ